MESYPNRSTFNHSDVLDGGTDMSQQPESRSAAAPFSHDDTPVAQAADSARQKAGGMLHGAKDRAERATDAVRNKVSSASNYVKHAQAADMWGDVKEIARKNPGASMLAVAVIGFAVGRSTSRSNSR